MNGVCLEQHGLDTGKEVAELNGMLAHNRNEQTLSRDRMEEIFQCKIFANTHALNKHSIFPLPLSLTQNAK